MENKNTIDSILDGFRVMSEEKQPLDVNYWLEGCAKLVVLLSDEQNKLFLLEQILAEQKLKLLEEGKSAAYAKIAIESTNDYVEARKLEAKIDQVTEIVRIGKLQARMSNDNIRNH